jgi:hypothetical protein
MQFRNDVISMKAVVQLLWPIVGDTVFMEFLIERFKLLAIQDYVRLHQNWYTNY